MATSEQGGGEATMFSDLVGLKEHSKGGGDDRVEEKEESSQGMDVSKVVRGVVKESLVPLIQRVMLKIDALDGKVKQMQLALEEMEEDGRERDVWLKKELEEMKGELSSVRGAAEEMKEGKGDEEVESESESEPDVGGLDIEELQALLNQKLALEEKKKKKKKKGDGEKKDHMLLYGDGGYRQQQGGVAVPPPSSSTLYGAAPPGPPPVHHHQHHLAPGSTSSSGGGPASVPPPPPHPPAGRGPPPPPGPPPVSSSSSSSYGAPGGQPHGQGVRVPPPSVSHDGHGMHSQPTLYTGQPSVNGGASYAAQPYATYQPTLTGPPPPAQQHQQPASSSGSVPIEKVIDDIAIMGFSREEVRNVLRELTAQGKSVDMNIVLDRLGAR